MTDIRPSDRDVSRAIRSWLHEDRHEDASRIAGAVLDRVEATPRRRATWWPARRMPIMNKLVTIGLGAAALVVLLVVGVQLFASGGRGLGGDPSVAPTVEPTPTTEPSVADPTSTLDDSLAEGPFLVFDPSTMQPPYDDGVPITVTIPARGWIAVSEFGALSKGDDANLPEWTGAWLLTESAGDVGYYVYGDPCHWESTTPATPATTVDEIVAALAAQPSRDPSDPVDVTVSGYAGKSITLHVPMSYESFADCDQDTYGSWGIEGVEGPTRWQQGPGQIDVLWILDVDGEIVVLDATYGPSAPAATVEEVHAMAESAEFGAP